MWWCPEVSLQVTADALEVCPSQKRSRISSCPTILSIIESIVI
jgi:hypothetical protein